MSGSQLHSIHLGSQPRRDDFRRARQRLLDARGAQTVIADQAGQGALIGSHSMILSPAPPPVLPADCSFALVDGELVYPLKVGINTVGRFLDSDVFLCEKYISRRHCVILVHTNGLCDLHDTASRNGTFLNGQRLDQPVVLRSGDCVRLCDREFIFLRLEDLPSKRVTSIDGDTQLE